MRPARWILGSTVLALGLLLLLALQVLGTHPARPRPQGHFYTGNYGPAPTSLNPFTTRNTVVRRYVLRFTHDALMDWDPETGQLRPAVAESVDPQPDGVTFIFTLREGVRFADGTPMTMEDVLFTWQVASNQSVPLGSLGAAFDLVDEVQALPGSPDRLRVVLKEPHADGLEAFAPDWTVVQKRHFLAEVDDLARQAGRPVPVRPEDEGFGELLAAVHLSGPGTGPYQLEEELQWPLTRELRLVQNPESWKRQTCDECWNLAGIRLLFLTDSSAVFTELLKGNLDWYNASDPEQLFEEYPALRNRYTPYLYDHSNLGHYWIQWNLRREPLRNAKVRRALSMLFNRDTIVNRFLGGRAVPAVSFFKPGTPYYPDAAVPRYDPKVAGELLREAGYDAERPLKIRIVAPKSPDGIFRRVLELADDTFNEVAEAELEFQVLENSAVLALQNLRDFDGLFNLHSHSGGVHPFPRFHSSQAGQNGLNHMGYENPKVDEILEEARSETDEARRIALFRQFDEIVRREQPATFLAHPLASMLINSNIEGVNPGPLGLVPERWWVPMELQRGR